MLAIQRKENIYPFVLAGANYEGVYARPSCAIPPTHNIFTDPAHAARDRTTTQLPQPVFS
jgi:hypothetical protein